MKGVGGGGVGGGGDKWGWGRIWNQSNLALTNRALREPLYMESVGDVGEYGVLGHFKGKLAHNSSIIIFQ